MKDPRRNLDRIPKENMTAYERWELPLLDAKGNEVAREEERNVKPLTAADIEKIRQEAYKDGQEEGHKEGYEAGHKEGLEKGHQEGFAAGEKEGRDQGEQQGLEETRKDVEARLERLEQVMGELLVPIQRHEDELETALVNLTTVLSRAVLYRELSLDSSQITAVVRKAMASLPSTSENVRIHIHPDDYDYVSEVAERFEAKASVVEDAAIMRGGCKLETRHSLVDYTIEKRFQKAVQDMLSEELDQEAAGEGEQLDAMMDDLTDFHRDVLDTDKPDDEPHEEDPAQDGSDQARGEGDDIPG
ncbi:flagellar assembly protein FliH [Marinobacter sp. CHS3-4]|uniref:flagellar assembly protein FliH n=1 Tax=Marinobacter sp. CHS3-4 TaxID=3045174 RepID=UPI0024B59C68|nr:flagellar assembly protein FliH [Marinobacter sp. CHS3-4]MDI9245914.1 flagellar assembly protein FliH [Marinobacter sp. CHS3-4]